MAATWDAPIADIIGDDDWEPEDMGVGDGDGAHDDIAMTAVPVVPHVVHDHDLASAGESGSYFPETKDNVGDEATTENGDVVGGGGRWAPFQPSEQAVTQGPGSEQSAVMVATGVDPTAAVASGTAPGGRSAVNSLKRHSMAFEMARIERARNRGKMPAPNPQRAAHAWSLSRPRYVERSDEPGQRVRLLPGQEHRDAVPYSVWRTGWAQMSDFGLDVGMYFVTIVQLTGVVLVYAALCVVAMVHFSSDGYSGGQVRRTNQTRRKDEVYVRRTSITTTCRRPCVSPVGPFFVCQ